MTKISVFSCPSCGASLSVDNEHDTLAKCQFCGNTVIVPEEMRPQRPRPGVGPTVPAQVLVAPGVAGGTGMDPIMAQAANLKELGRLVRAGDRSEAVQLYHQTFGGSLTDAQAAVDALAAGRPVQVSSTSLGAPIRIQTPSQAPAQPYVVAGQPANVGRRQGRSLGCALMGFILTLSAGIIVLVLSTVSLGSLGMLGTLLPGGVLPAGLVPAGYAREVLAFGGTGTGIGVFTDPRHVAVDADGNIYVGEYQNPRIQVFDAQGKFITQWQLGTRQTILSSMAVDREGVLYAVHESLIHRYDGMTGEALEPVAYEGGWGFDSIAMAADGGFVASWRKGTDTLVRFNRNGQAAFEIPEAISGVTGDSELKMTVAIDGQGRIFALGSFNDAVFGFGPEGRYVNKFGGEGDGDGQFRAPTALAVDNQSRVFVSDIKGIQVFDADGRYINKFDPPGHSFGLVFDDTNALYVVGGDDMVRKFVIQAP
jgi:hypothetical protein